MVRYTRTVLAVAAAAAIVASPALAKQDDGKPGKRDGIEHAKAAGMTIDPKAEPLMERAPIGWCPNDPTLPKCPEAHAVKFTGGTSFADDGKPEKVTAR